MFKELGMDLVNDDPPNIHFDASYDAVDDHHPILGDGAIMHCWQQLLFNEAKPQVGF